MKKYLLFFVLYLLPMIANADDNGTCGDNLTWFYDVTTKTLTISGTGDMSDYTKENVAPWFSLEFEKLIVEAGAKTIGNYAFNSCSTLKEISLPNTLSTIGGDAFNGCTSLTSVIIPNGVTSIFGMAFYGCTNLTSVTIPNSITFLGGYVPTFVDCNLKRVFCYCLNLKSNTSQFSQASYNHAVLYVPEGKRWEAIYDGGWYNFINIRETAMDASQLSPKKAYTLMNAQSYVYSVYDAVNNRVKNVEDFYNVDESVANNSWQIVEVNGKKCLYNIGAKKYAQISSSGEWSMSEIAVPLDMQSDEDGKISINGQHPQWYFVLNEHLSPDNNATAITDGINTPNKAYYTLDGKRLNEPRKGIYIVKMSNGTTKKVVVK